MMTQPMTMPARPPWRDEPFKPPLHGFFARAEALATSAFLTIPFVGGYVADFFNNVIVPVCTPPRDRAMVFFFCSFKRLEGRLQVALIRLLPLPSGRPASRSPR
jgi:hypothetical protein